MIPTLEEIIRMLVAGQCSHEQALGWLEDHERRKAEDMEGTLR